MSDQAATCAATARLLDGRIMSLRRLNGDDARAVMELHQQLSGHDRYLRFFTLQPVAPTLLAGELTGPADGRYAIGGFDGERLIGVANYRAVPDDPKTAEVAIVVAHADHSVGVGTALLKQLAEVARTSGIGRFVADVLAGNHLMLMVLFDLGWACKPTDYGSIRHLEIELPEAT